MKVSMKGDYGVRALVELAHHFGEGPVQSAAIAARQGIPEPYLDQLLTSLRRAGFIRSVRIQASGSACAKTILLQGIYDVESICASAGATCCRVDDLRFCVQRLFVCVCQCRRAR